MRRNQTSPVSLRQRRQIAGSAGYLGQKLKSDNQRKRFNVVGGVFDAAIPMQPECRPIWSVRSRTAAPAPSGRRAHQPGQ
jgi:hypothetical protein